MLECAVLPSRVRKLRIYGKAALYQSLAKVELPATKCLELHISSNTEGYPNVIASLNRIFTSAQWSDNELLHDSVGSRVALPRCGVSRGLTVATAIDADTIIELIQMLPRLTELRLSYCVLSAIRTDISIPEPGAHQPIEPFDTRIQRLECCLSRENRPPELEIQLVRFLLLKIPTLTKLVATTVSRQAIDSFINEYVQWYPHLSRVDLEFY
ncbi:hypothetical protein LPJ61_006755 [Coemansia biformis]|uniref:Uncharacterized protein n=1 Tax=Coemansia biformis TaxID=1286918 RepID=A0A9W8CMA3_9FUNG|nr:hypothetical protein LPJ61_006755 [Coemansia biformis]